MRRMIPVLTAVATLAVASSAFAGHTAVELYQYFGDPQVGPSGGSPGAPTNSNPSVNPQVDILQGSGALSVWFPIYMELRAGNGRPTLTGVGFQVYESGTLTGLTTNGGNTAVSPFALDGSTLAPVAGTNAAHSAGGYGTMFRNTQFHAKDATVGDPGNGTYFLGWMCVDLAPGYVLGQMASFDFSVSTDAARTYGFATVNASLNTIAFGADAGNVEGDGDGVNAFRFQNTNLDVAAATAGAMSTLAGDAKINIIVPEPTTIGLLGLGLLAIRRRRA